MPEPLCIYCYDPVTTENGDPLYLHASADMPDAAPKRPGSQGLPCRGASRFEIGDIPENDLEALREYARNSNQ